MMRKIFLTIAVTASIFVLAAAAQATTVTNLTTSALVFSDDYEGLGDSVSHIAYPDGSGDYDPVAQVGSWTVVESSTGQQIQVTDFNNPGSCQGDNYLRMVRTASAPDNTFNYALGILSAEQSTTGNHIRFETMFLYDEDGINPVGPVMLYGASGILANVMVYSDGTVRTRTGSDYGVATGQTYTVGEWTYLAIDYNVGDDTYSLTINDTTVTDRDTWFFAGDSMTHFRFAGGTDSPMYYDAVPEPSVLVLALAGLVGLAALARKKRA